MYRCLFWRQLTITLRRFQPVKRYKFNCSLLAELFTIVTARGKVMFSYVSVCSVSQSVQDGGLHWTSLYRDPPPTCTLAPNPRVSDMGPPALPPTPASDILGPVQLVATPKHVRWAGGQYVSYWNAFFFSMFLIQVFVVSGAHCIHLQNR